MTRFDRRSLLAAGLAATFTTGAEARLDRSRIARVDAFLDDVTQSRRLPCAALAVYERDRLVHMTHTGWGDVEARTPLAPDALYRIYSMTKPITACAILKLYEEGKLLLSDPVARFVPEFANLVVFDGVENGEMRTRPARIMTIEHLLSHTSGLSYNFNPNSPVAALYARAGLSGGEWFHDASIAGLDDVVARLARIPLEFQPGSAWCYSMGLDVAGLVVERASGQAFDQFLAERIFEPLRMRDTGFQTRADNAQRLINLYGPSPQGLRLLESGAGSVFHRPMISLSGGGGLISTLEDYSRFARMLCNDGVGQRGRILAKSTIDLMMLDHVGAAADASRLASVARFGYGGSGEGLSFGLGGAVVTDVAATNSAGSLGEYGWGGAASTTFWVDRSRQLAAIFMSQLLPSGTVPMRDWLKALVYQALDG